MQIKLEQFSFKYALGNKKAIDNINLEIKEREFVVIFGSSGSGKSTLLRSLKPEITPAGEKNGSISISEKLNIAIVFQDPNTQLISHSIIDDLVFHMENLGYDQNEMKKRLVETVHYFGLESLLHKNHQQLSGGQKQLLVLCSALMTRPDILLLDEPASQLDPIALREFFAILSRINEEFGVTIVMTEHRLDDAITYADRLLFMENGEIKSQGNTKEVLNQIAQLSNKTDTMLFVPSIPRLCHYLKTPQMCLSVKEFKNLEQQNILPKVTVTEKEIPFMTGETKTLLKLNNIFYTYDSQLEFTLKKLNLEIKKGERICILGGNGSGKSTLLKLIAKIIKPSFGNINFHNSKIAYLPQDLKLFFRFDTVKKEIEFNAKEIDYDLLKKLKLDIYLETHPLDLSGGEAGKLAIFCILMQKPDMILLDEPTKGLDPYAKKYIHELLINSGATILMATHDLEFSVSFATKCNMIFDGEIAFASNPRNFFSENYYYTTKVHLATRQLSQKLFLAEDVF